MEGRMSCQVCYRWSAVDKAYCLMSGGGGSGKMQASMAAFLSRSKVPSNQADAEAVTVAAHESGGASVSQQEQQQAQEPPKQLPPSSTQHQQQAEPPPAQEKQPTYAAQLSAAIAASLEASGGLPAEAPPAPEAADKSSPSGEAVRLPTRTDSRLDVQNNGQYRAWAAFISPAGQGKQVGGSGGGNQSSAATAWQVRISP